MMKKKRIIGVLLLIGIIVSTVGCAKDAPPQKSWYKDNPFLQEGTDAYDYSTLPAYPEECTISMSEYYDVPQEQAGEMSTQGLLITCLEYPATVFLYITDSYLEGYKSIKDGFAPLRELTTRDNAAEILAAFYSSVDYEDVQKSTDSSIIKMRFLEMIIADEDLIKRTDETSRKKLIKEGVSKVIDNINNYDRAFGTNTTLYMISQLLYQDSEEFRKLADDSEEVSYFVKGETDYLLDTVKEETIYSIIEIAEEYIKQ